MRSFHLLHLCVAILGILLFTGTTTYALQPTPISPLPTPLYLWSRGDLYVVADIAAPPRRLTDIGTISGPARSPDGTWIAYKAASPLGIDALDRVETAGLIADFDLPADIFAYLIDSNTILPLTNQPADASLFNPDRPDRAILRSAPAWSPDGTALAWTEVDFPSGNARLIRYDLNAAAARTLTDLPPQPDHLSPLPLLWGRGGIAIDLSVDAGSDQFEAIYDGTTGALIGAVGVAAVAQDSVRLSTWVDDTASGRALFGLLYESGGWALIDPVNNTAVPYTFPPSLMTVSASDSSQISPIGWALRFGVDSRLGFYWEIAGTNSAAASDPNRTTLSPDGQHLAIAGIPAAGTVSVFDGADLLQIPGTGVRGNDLPVGAVIWGNTAWVMSPG